MGGDVTDFNHRTALPTRLGLHLHDHVTVSLRSGRVAQARSPLGFLKPLRLVNKLRHVGRGPIHHTRRERIAPTGILWERGLHDSLDPSSPTHFTGKNATLVTL
jgi:hypothetical protein